MRAFSASFQAYDPRVGLELVFLESRITAVCWRKGWPDKRYRHPPPRKAAFYFVDACPRRGIACSTGLDKAGVLSGMWYNHLTAMHPILRGLPLPSIPLRRRPRPARRRLLDITGKRWPADPIGTVINGVRVKGSKCWRPNGYPRTLVTAVRVKEYDRGADIKEMVARPGLGGEIHLFQLARFCEAVRRCSGLAGLPGCLAGALAAAWWQLCDFRRGA